MFDVAVHQKQGHSSMRDFRNLYSVWGNEKIKICTKNVQTKCEYNWKFYLYFLLFEIFVFILPYAVQITESRMEEWLCFWVNSHIKHPRKTNLTYTAARVFLAE